MTMELWLASSGRPAAHARRQSDPDSALAHTACCAGNLINVPGHRVRSQCMQYALMPTAACANTVNCVQGTAGCLWTPRPFIFASISGWSGLQLRDHAGCSMHVVHQCRHSQVGASPGWTTMAVAPRPRQHAACSAQPQYCLRHIAVAGLCVHTLQ